MAIPVNLIKWSNLQVSKKDNIFAKIGIGIEDRSGSLTDGTKDTVLDISIWFQANKAFFQESGHILTINSQQKKVLPINAKPNESVIIYFETLSFDKSLSGYLDEENREMSDILIDVSLLNISNFSENFKITEKKSAVVLNSYPITFNRKFDEDNIEVLDLAMKKYHSNNIDNYISYPFYLYKTDFEDYINYEKDNVNYKLVSIVNDNINFNYNLQNKQSEAITENDELKLNFYLIYEKIKHTITYNGNGGTYNGLVEIKQDNEVEAPIFNRDGYEQNGWSYSPSIYGDSIEIDNIPKNKDIVLYAQWKRKDITITYFSENIEAIDMPNTQTFKYNDIITISNQIPQSSQYTFLKWKDTKGNYYFPEEVLSSLSENLVLTAEWSIQEYTIQYIFPNGEIKKETFIKNDGFIKEDVSGSGSISDSQNNQYKYFSYGINDKIPDKQINDKLENCNHTLYAMVYSEVNIVYYYNNKNYTDTKNIYNHGNVLQNYKPRQPMLYVINTKNSAGESVKKYFQYWKKKNDPSEQIYSSNLHYDLPLTIDNAGKAQDIEFEAVYGENESIEHNIFITKNDGISLIAEDFNEDNTLTKSKYSITIDNTKKDVEGFIFFNQGNAIAKEFKEKDAKIQYNIGSKETGIFNFDNYIQEIQLKKQLLQISLKELDEAGLGYVVLDDATEALTNDDIYISL